MLRKSENFLIDFFNLTTRGGDGKNNKSAGKGKKSVFRLCPDQYFSVLIYICLEHGDSHVYFNMSGSWMYIHVSFSKIVLLLIWAALRIQLMHFVYNKKKVRNVKLAKKQTREPSVK